MTAIKPPESALLRPRPANVEQFRALVQEGRGQPFSAPAGFTVQPSDIIIASYPKCGTTWLQQIVHGLRSGGAMDFAEISLVVPWIEGAAILGIDLNAPQVATPRAFKSHLSCHLLPSGGRKIFITRDPGDALLSSYRFMSGVMFEPGSVDIESFAAEFFFCEMAAGRYWEHLREWWPQRQREDVLFLCYETLKMDLRSAVVRIAAFSGIEADATLIDLVTHQAGFEFMRAHQQQFDDQPTLTAFMQLMRLPNARTTKVRTGRIGDSKETLSAQLLAQLAQQWHDEIAQPLGLDSYQALREVLRNEERHYGMKTK